MLGKNGSKTLEFTFSASTPAEKSFFSQTSYWHAHEREIVRGTMCDNVTVALQMHAVLDDLFVYGILGQGQIFRNIEIQI